MRRLGYTIALIFCAGCATVGPPQHASDPAHPGQRPEIVVEKDLPSSNGTVEVQGNDLFVNGMKLKNTHFDIPITINSRVEYWIDYFTGKGRQHFERYLERSEYFVPYIVPLLHQNGMPQDFVYLAMIESGFNNLARSHAKAVGPWQFISATGKRYGLMVNWWVDERRDIRKSTLAAVEYLKDLYSLFRSWELAAASYNAGEAKVARAIQRYGTKDFWELSRHRFLRPETRDYVPKIIAAAILAKNRTQFGFKEAVQKPGEGEAVSGAGEIVKLIKTDKPLEDDPKAEKVGDAEAAAAADDDDEPGDQQLISDLDLADDEVAASHPITTSTLSAPPQPPSATKEDKQPQIVTNDQPLARPVPVPHVSKSGEVGGEELSEFEVQSPADLLKVARAAGLSYQTVKSLNPELLRWCTPPTVSSYRIKLPVSVKGKFLETYNHAAFPRQVTFLTYKVRKGETLQKIARFYGIKVDPISDLNGVSPRLPLRKGVHVLLPIPNDRSRSLASLDVRDPPERPGRSHRRHRPKYYRITYKHRASARQTARAQGDS
jgi:LysM repeat protein